MILINYVKKCQRNVMNNGEDYGQLLSQKFVLQGILLDMRFYHLTPQFSMRQISASRTLRQDYVRVRGRRMSRIVSKRRAVFFLSLTQPEISKKSNILALNSEK